MKITRFTQSCLLLELDSTRILVDPSGEEAGNDFGKLNAVFYTHQHADHFDAPLAEKLRGQGAVIYTNQSTSQLLSGDVKIIHDREDFVIGSFKITAIELPHCLMPNAAVGPQNTGYLFNKVLFDPGDGKELAGLKVPNLMLPITGPDISMKEAFDFAKQVDAKTAFPVHYDKLGANPEVYKSFAEMLKMPFTIKVLPHGQPTEI